MLTPIRVRGRRYKEDTAERRDISHIVKHKSRGRPLKSIKELSSSQVRRPGPPAKRQRQTPHDLSPMLKSKPLSKLESLPNEVIELIFLSSLEFNLPRSSPVLCGALSRGKTYKILILYAFFRDDQRHPVQTQCFKPATYKSLSADERLELQISVLNAKWCSLPRVEACLPDLFHLRVNQTWHQKNERKKDAPIHGPSFQMSAEVAGDGAASTEPKPVFAFPARQPPATPPQEYIRDSHSNPSSLKPWLSASLGRVMDVLVLPSKLLHGPWTSEKIAFLRLLRQAHWFASRNGYRDDHKLPQGLRFSLDVLTQGLQDAIAEDSVYAFKVLADLPHVTHYYFSSRKSAYPPTLFVQAARHAYKHENFLPLLIRASADSLPKDDSTITAWALAASSKGDEFAKWLLDYMADASSKPVFVNGKFDDTSFLTSSQRYPACLTEARTWKAEIGYDLAADEQDDAGSVVEHHD